MLKSAVMNIGTFSGTLDLRLFAIQTALIDTKPKPHEAYFADSKKVIYYQSQIRTACDWWVLSNMISLFPLHKSNFTWSWNCNLLRVLFTRWFCGRVFRARRVRYRL